MKRWYTVATMSLLLLLMVGIYWVQSQTDETPLTSPAVIVSASAPAPSPISVSRQNAITQAISAVGSSVVGVEVIGRGMSSGHDVQDFFQFFFGPRDRRSLGSGFVVRFQDRDYVLTNAHVVDGAEQIKLVLSDGRAIGAHLIGQDAALDVAVLEPEMALGLAPLELGDSDDLMIGEWVIAIGNPEGLQNTVTVGVVSGIHRRIPRGDGTFFSNLIQTDAAINPGNSGGPLINAEGRVIGMNTVIIRLRRSAQGVPLEGLNFAVAINDVKGILPQLLAAPTSARTLLGVSAAALTPEHVQQLDVTTGVLVSRVAPGSKASFAGVRVGEVILEINRVQIRSLSDWERTVQTVREADGVWLTLWRGGMVRLVFIR